MSRMMSTTNILDIIENIKSDLDKFKENWIENNKINPANWPLEIPNDNIGIVFEQFSMYDPNTKIEAIPDIDCFINSVGFTDAYNIIKHKPAFAECYNPSTRSYYRMEAFCINLDTLKNRLDELTKDLKLIVTFSYTDKDWPYAYQDDTIVTLNSPLEVDDWIANNTGRRESYSVKKLVWSDK